MPIIVLTAMTAAKIASFHAPAIAIRIRKPSAIAFTSVNTFSRTIRVTMRDPVSGSPRPEAREPLRCLGGGEPAGVVGRHGRRWYPERSTMPPMLPPLAERRPDLAVAAADLRLNVGAESFAFATTAELDAPGVLLGQKRAVEALELGLDDARSRCARVRRRATPAPAAAPPSRACWRGSRRRCRCRPTACS